VDGAPPTTGSNSCGQGGERRRTHTGPTLWLSVPVVVIVKPRLPGVRYYISPQPDAILAVRAARDGWHVDGHVSSRPGTGQGRALRAALLPDLLAAADAAADVAILTTAANARLAQIYTTELDGLGDVGQDRLGRRKFRREPRPTGAGDVAHASCAAPRRPPTGVQRTTTDARPRRLAAPTRKRPDRNPWSGCCCDRGPSHSCVAPEAPGVVSPGRPASPRMSAHPRASGPRNPARPTG